ncbi:hypothetical protein Micbo1qcDRAFT_23216 [Microdochium bolleyi]|uniref:Nucleotidyltransferase family protein n=1 Tax=Microdochium bolleyi TaxID=196109 RepID=A0A136IR09_9PEZI|nr:hypothetical protein Micbo1qcDRAFT_23216 [Microdochium bolleyi]
MAAAAANPAQLPLQMQLVHLHEVLSTNKTLVQVLTRAASLKLPHWYLAGGAVSQTIWNHVSHLPPETGIHDYDLVYFDDADLSYEAEDAVIQSSRAMFAEVLPRPEIEVEIRNQARVHLWYEKRFGMPCSPHASTEAAIDTWISTSAMIGVRLEPDGQWTTYAPRGLSDFFNMIVRPCPRLGTRDSYQAKVLRWKKIWPDLNVEPWPEHEGSRN